MPLFFFFLVELYPLYTPFFPLLLLFSKEKSHNDANSFCGKSHYISWINHKMKTSMFERVTRQGFLDLFQFLFCGKQRINPMNRTSTAFHTSKPSHLTLRKLMNCRFELLHHLVIGELPSAVQRQIFILQTIIN